MENGIKMIFVSKWVLIPVEYIDSNITIWPPDDISLIYSCWVTYLYVPPALSETDHVDTVSV